MKLFALLLLISTSGWAMDVDRCCLCIADATDKVLGEQHCQRWAADEAQKGCGKILILKNEKAEIPESDLSCRKVEIRAAFHGLSDTFYLPFKIAKDVSQKFHPEEVTYSGFTCSLFNNTAMVEIQAQHLASANKHVRYSFAGNQNIGIVNGETLSEIYDASSKMFVNIESGSVSVSYDKCSDYKGRCGNATQDISAQNDPDTKLCSQDGAITQQQCCHTRRGQLYGQWSRPGSLCK
jgi:hypothetical protein